MKKIILDKDEDVAEAIDRILAEPDTSVVLVVPRGSFLVRSARNFHLLKREMDATGRHLEVESVDEQILALAKEAKIPGRHPLLTRASGGSVSDIVAVVAKRESETTITVEDDRNANGKKKNGKGRRGSEAPEAVKIEVREEEASSFTTAPSENMAKETEEGDEAQETDQETESAIPEKISRFFRERNAAPAEEDEDDYEGNGAPPRRGPWKAIGIVIGVILVAGIIFFGITRFFGHAEITIDFAKTPWNAQATFTADKSLAKADPVADALPAQVFTATKNVTQLFPASGSATVNQKAQGTLTIYNAYSSAVQTLVATTRFVTPTGLIFRLTGQVIVPGAQVTNGQIVPSSITAQVVADQAGPTYNIGPVAKLTVPGFQGTPKFDGFYGAIASGTTGGFSGTKAVPTAADITAAKASTTLVLQNALQSAAGFDIPSNLKILNGATTVQITKLSVNTSTDQNGQFSVFGQVAYQAIGFDESMLKATLLAQAQATKASSTWSALALSYSNVRPDFTNGRVAFTLVANGSLAPIFSADDWKTGIAGDSIADAKAAIAALPNLQDGAISVWPVWLWNIPSDPAKISVTVQ
jgi:hypothetical protein